MAMSDTKEATLLVSSVDIIESITLSTAVSAAPTELPRSIWVCSMDSEN